MVEILSDVMVYINVPMAMMKTVAVSVHSHFNNLHITWSKDTWDLSFLHFVMNTD